MPNDPNEQGRDYRRAEDDPERSLREIAAGRHAGELAGEEFEMIFDHGEIGSGLVDLPQCELVLICHINRHQRSTFANPRNSRNLRRCPLVSSKCEWPTSVLA